MGYGARIMRMARVAIYVIEGPFKTARKPSGVPELISPGSRLYPGCAHDLSAVGRVLCAERRPIGVPQMGRHSALKSVHKSAGKLFKQTGPLL